MAKPLITVPVIVPKDDGGATDAQMGEATLADGTLVVKFKDNNFPGLALQRMIDRGELLGITFVMLDKNPQKGDIRA